MQQKVFTIAENAPVARETYRLRLTGDTAAITAIIMHTAVPSQSAAPMKRAHSPYIAHAVSPISTLAASGRANTLASRGLSSSVRHMKA